MEEEEEEEEEKEKEREGRTVLGRRLTGMCRVRRIRCLFPALFFDHPTKLRRHRIAIEETPNPQRNKDAPRPGIEPGSSVWQAEILTTILPRI